MRQKPASADPTGQQTRPMQRPGFLAALGFLTLAAGLGAASLLWEPGSGPAPAVGQARPSTPAGQVPAQTGQAASAEPSGDGGDCPGHLARPASGSAAQPVLDQAPSGVKWTLYQGVAGPVSAHGPLVITEGGLARCFERSPAGALTAAWQISTRFVLASDWEKVLDRQVVAGPGREVFRAQRAQVRLRPEDVGSYGQLAGFRFASYTPEVATIQLVSRFSAGAMQVNTVTVVWSGGEKDGEKDGGKGGDWRLQLQKDGSISPSVTPVSSVAGFIPWAGV